MGLRIDQSGVYYGIHFNLKEDGDVEAAYNGEHPAVVFAKENGLEHNINSCELTGCKLLIGRRLFFISEFEVGNNVAFKDPTFDAIREEVRTTVEKFKPDRTCKLHCFWATDT